MNMRLPLYLLPLTLISCGSMNETEQAVNKESVDGQVVGPVGNTDNNLNDVDIYSSPSWDYPQLDKVNFAIFGDSISKGLFAHRTFDNYDLEAPIEKAILSALSNPTSQDSLNLGDSLKNDPQHSREDLTATASTQLWSIPSYLAEEHGVTNPSLINIVNHSISGEKVSSVIGKFDNTLQHGTEKIDYTIVFLGSNDFCNSSTAAEFESNLTQLFDKILAKDVYKESRLIILSMPDFKHLNTFDSTFQTGLIPLSIKSHVRSRICSSLQSSDALIESRQKNLRML